MTTTVHLTWVGGGALILAGVRIGSRAVIGAGSVVTRDLPAHVLAVGNGGGKAEVAPPRCCKVATCGEKATNRSR